MILGFIFLTVQILFGISVFSFFDPEKKFHFFEKIAGSVLLGLTISYFIILASSVIFESLPLGFLVFLLIFITTFAIRRLSFFDFISDAKLFFSSKKVFSRKTIWLFFLLLVLLVYWAFISTVLFKSKDNTFLAVLIGWGDTALHLSLIERFATAHPFNLDHPMMAGVSLTYPFMIDFASALYAKLGLDKLFAYRLPFLLFGGLAILLIFAFSCRILKSKILAFLVLFFILLGSGLGFFTLFNDLSAAQKQFGLAGAISLISNPPHEYTHLDNRTGGKPAEKNTPDNIVWIAPIISFFGHQRSFTMGFALFAFLLLGIYHYGKNKYFWRFGIILALIPFSHGHTFLAFFLLSAVLFWFYLSNWKSWVKFGLITALISFPQLLYYKLNSNIIEQSFLKPWFGWMACEHKNSWFFCDKTVGTDSNAFIFWIKNFGVVFLIWLAVLIFLAVTLAISSRRNKFKNNFQLPFVIASFVIFLLPNFFLFQPWEFDNNKVLFYWWLLAIIFAVVPVLKIIWKKNILAKIFVVFLIFFGVLAGSFDFGAKFLWTKELGSFGYADWLKENNAAAEWIKENSQPNDIFLTAPSVDPIPLFLAGRPLYLGYEGWLWTQGLNHQKNRQNAENILKGDMILACSEKVKFIFLDNALRNSFNQFDENFLKSKAKIIYSQDTPYEKRGILKIECDTNQ